MYVSRKLDGEWEARKEGGGGGGGGGRDSQAPFVTGPLELPPNPNPNPNPSPLSPAGKVALEMYQALTDIQSEKAPDPKGWVSPVA